MIDDFDAAIESIIDDIAELQISLKQLQKEFGLTLGLHRKDIAFIQDYTQTKMALMRFQMDNYSGEKFTALKIDYRVEQLEKDVNHLIAEKVRREVKDE